MAALIKSVHVVLASVAALTAVAAAEPFGLRLRPAPSTQAAIGAPVVIREAPTNETCLVARRDGALELYAVAKPAGTAIAVRRSLDGGLTWTEPTVAFPLPGPAYYAVQALAAADGSLHAVTHVLSEGPGGYRGRLYEVYYARKAADGNEWSPPRKIVSGYVGSIRGFVQLDRGRLVLAVARAIPERTVAPKAGPDYGWNDTFVYYSDDLGTTWQQSPDVLTLELKTANATRYGAIEPVLLELRDGRLWMLVRDRQGRLQETFSADGGVHWPALTPTRLISSDSPAALRRLRDGRILLLTNACQNWSNPRSYAMGGREVLHAALSADEGRTWRGFREVLVEPVAETRGDRGTAYASAVENAAGKIVVVSGQGEGKRAILAFDPRWLEATSVSGEDAASPAAWTAYGGQAGQPLRAEGGPAGGLVITGQPAAPCGASWNFPIASGGEINLALTVTGEVSALELALNDHFTRIDDGQAPAHAVWSGPLRAVNGTQRVRLRWQDTTGAGHVVVEIDGRDAVVRLLQRPAQFGLNYLRLQFRVGQTGGTVALRDVAMRTRP